MPRKKYDTPHRSRVVKTRMTEEEYADFAARLAPYGISQSEFIRRAIQGASIRPVVTVSPVNDELLAALGKLTAEYGRIGNIALWKLPRGTNLIRAASADCSRACIPPICGFGKVRRRRKNEGSAHKDAPRASAPAAESRQQCAHRSRRAVHSDLTGHVHPGAK